MAILRIIGSVGRDLNFPTGDQTIGRENEPSWVVLGIEDKDGNGVNETLLITTSSSTSDALYLYGEYDYNNGVEILNRICKELYGNNARSIKVDDIYNCINYYPEYVSYYDRDEDWVRAGEYGKKINLIDGFLEILEEYNVRNFNT